jgi:hypothetical protein
VKEGFADFEVARVLSWRFMAVGLLAFPLGLFIKGRRLKPFFWMASALVPLCSFLIIWAIEMHYTILLYGGAMIWGIGFTFMQITILPFIILNTEKEAHSEAISLSFLSFSAMICVVGFLYAILNRLAPDLFDERNVLIGLSFLSLISLYFMSRVKVKERVSRRIPLRAVFTSYDWGLIGRAVIPTLVIAVGAGFTIPVINLFFLNVHGVPSEVFSILGATTFLLVALVMVFMPAIKRRFGYKVAITLFQSLAVFALFMLATTEYYREWEYALYVAIFFYVIRQPLMNSAGPMTSELTLYYVGAKNQEILSALNASIWSGSWFISTSLFAWMRQLELRYVSIFLITVGLYIVGVALYWWLIRDFERRKLRAAGSGKRKETASEAIESR